MNIECQLHEQDISETSITESQHWDLESLVSVRFARRLQLWALWQSTDIGMTRPMVRPQQRVQTLWPDKFRLYVFEWLMIQLDVSIKSLMIAEINRMFRLLEKCCVSIEQLSSDLEPF